MYQLSHMLTDQKGIMNTLMELSLTGDNGRYNSDTTDKMRQLMSGTDHLILYY